MMKQQRPDKRATHSFSFFPLRRFLPPFPLFFGILTERAQAKKSGCKNWVVPEIDRENKYLTRLLWFGVGAERCR